LKLSELPSDVLDVALAKTDFHPDRADSEIPAPENDADERRLVAGDIPPRTDPLLVLSMPDAALMPRSHAGGVPI